MRDHPGWDVPFKIEEFLEAPGGETWISVFSRRAEVANFHRAMIRDAEGLGRNEEIVVGNSRIINRNGAAAIFTSAQDNLLGLRIDRIWLPCLDEYRMMMKEPT